MPVSVVIPAAPARTYVSPVTVYWEFHINVP